MFDPVRHNKRDNYLHGKCNILAYTINQKFKLPIFTITEERINKIEGLVHAFCVLDKNTNFIDEDTICLDAGGICSFKEIEEAYDVHSNCKINKVNDPDTVLNFGYYLTGHTDKVIVKELELANDYLSKYLISSGELSCMIS